MKRTYIWAPVAVLALVVTFTGGFLLGHSQAEDLLDFGKADLSNFAKAKRLIQEKYVSDVSQEDLLTGATKGLVAGTGDPYSEYLTKEEADQLDQQLAGTVEGIGVEIGLKNDLVMVIAPLPDSPAARGGIVAGDMVLAVNGESVVGKDIDEVAQKIRGPKGSQVTVEVRGPGQSAARSLALTRETVKSPSVTLTYRGDPGSSPGQASGSGPGQAVAIIRLSQFGETTKDELNTAITDIQAKKPRGIVLDMRSNPGGYLEGAVDVTSVFLSDGAVVKEQFAHGKSETRSATKDARLAAYPLVVLVDKGSASAAEITAGALRDDRQTKLVGEKTYGKGSVQELEDLGGGAVLKLTIAEWLTPNGTSISKQGLKPDVESPSTDPEAQVQAAIGQLK